MSTNEKILAGIKRGDQDVFKQLFDMFYHRLFLYAKSYVDQEEVARDIVQDLFLYVWRKRATINITTSVSSYLFRAVHNKSIQYLRHQQVSENYNSIQALKQKEAELLYHHEDDFTSSSLEYEEMNNVIDETLRSLPEKTKQIFSLSRKGGMTNQQISNQLQVDIKTVEYHITKALKAFKNSLKDYI